MNTTQNDPTPPPAEFNEFDGILARIQARTAAVYERVREAAQDRPSVIRCETHDIERRIYIDASALLTQKAGPDVPAVIAYAACPVCAADARLAQQSEWLHSKGVPRNLLHCSLDNYRPASASQEAALKSAREFVARRRGFLVLCGDGSAERNFGIGKSHLAVGIIRAAGFGRFITHDALMQAVGRRYEDKGVENITEACMKVRLLVIDEVGLSRGGSDDIPTMHRILAHRYGEKLPTVLTSNNAYPQITAYVGERLADRLTESVHRVCAMSGESYRSKERAKYWYEEEA